MWSGIENHAPGVEDEWAYLATSTLPVDLD
jgi:hypothetical protein